jgi:excisionase family DNA binding protein
MANASPPTAHPGSAEMPFRLFTTIEAAKILGLGKRTVQERVAARELACIKVGKSTRFAAEDLTAFVERNRQKAVGWKGVSKS